MRRWGCLVRDATRDASLGFATRAAETHVLTHTCGSRCLRGVAHCTFRACFRVAPFLNSPS
jgi:hypothetical protein